MPMRNRTRRPSFKSYVAGRFGFLELINHQRVLPNETLLEHSVKFRLQSLPIKTVLAGAYVDTYSFFVPYRVCWASWPDFLVAGSPAVPTLGADAPTALSFAGEPSLVQLARNHVLENFFQNDIWPAPSTVRNLPYVDQLGDQKIADPDTFPASEVVTMEVQSGSPDYVELDMDALREAQYLQRMRDLQGRFSSEYADILAAYGVDDLGGVAVAEYLGGARRWHYPSRTIDQSTGESVQSYMLDGGWKRDRKKMYFREHGVLLDFVALRPSAYPIKAKNSEYLLSEPADFMFPVPRATFRKNASSMYPSAPGDLDLRSPLWHGEYRFGATGVGSGADVYVHRVTVDADEDLYYPDYAGMLVETEAGQNGYAVDCKITTSFRTWLDRPQEPEPKAEP